MLERGDWSYVGIDESNHGQTPEIFVAVYSNYQKDLQESQRVTIPKKRNASHRRLPALLSSRAYSFVLVTGQDIEFLKRNSSYDALTGLVVASLFHEEDIVSAPEIYIDGELLPQRMRYLQKAISLVPEIDAESVKIQTGKNLDRRVQLVNIADETAHWLYQQPLEKLSKRKQQKPLRTELLERLIS